MKSQLGQKSIACLLIAGIPPRNRAGWWDRLYAEACEQYSEKATCATFERLSRKGYIDYGVSARTGWLTDKGRAALQAAFTDKGDESSGGQH